MIHDLFAANLDGRWLKFRPSLDPGLILAALLALFAIVPLLSHSGLPNTADGPVHLMRQAELNQAWRDGILYPRWAPDLAYGYGMPLFHYAPPLLYHVTQIIHLTGLPLDASMKGTIILMIILYSVGMYLFARDLFGPRPGLLAAAVYLYAPYRLREVYIQGNYGQFCGLAFYPLILWSFHGLVTTNRRRYLPLAALSLTGLLLSHNISAMLFAPLFGAYLVFLWIGNRKMRATDSPAPRFPIPNFLPPIIAIALGLGLSAFFWLPAFGERDLIRLSGITTGFFDFRYNFISPAELLALPRPLDLSAINPYYPLSLGLAQMVFAVLAMLVLGVCCALRIAYCASPVADDRPVAAGPSGSRAIRHTLFFSGILVVYAFLALPQSQPIWEAMPLLELAEFPWRMLGPAVLCTAVLAGAALHLFEGLGADRWGLVAGNWSLGTGLFFTLAVNLFYLFPSQFIPWGTPTPADVVAYEVQSGAIGTTSTGEFLPRWTDRYPSPETLGPDYAVPAGCEVPAGCTAGRLPAKLDPASLPTGAVATTLAHTAHETRVAVSSPEPFVATFRALYWPGWRVIMVEGAGGDGGRPIEIQITEPDGLIRAPLPAGEYQVSLRLFATPIRRAGTVISVLSLMTFLGLALIRRVSESANQRIPNLQYPISNIQYPISLLIVGLLITRPLADWFQVQSPPDAVHGAQHTLQADFGDQVRLLAFDLPPCAWWVSLSCSRRVLDPPGADMAKLPQVQVKAGGSLPVVLYWRALEPLTTNYSVFVHLDAPDGRTYASADERHPADIPTSHWPPSLYLRNPLILALPADAPPIRYTLTAGLTDPQTDARLPVTACEGCPPAGGAGDALPLAHVWLLPTTPLTGGDIPHQINYRLGDQITLLGYDLTGTAPTTLTLYWRTSAPMETVYTVFVHALDADGEMVAQFDAPPLNGLYPTNAWLPGQIIADAHPITLPESAQTVVVGLYDPGRLVRLPVTDENGRPIPHNTIRLQATGSGGQGADDR